MRRCSNRWGAAGLCAAVALGAALMTPPVASAVTAHPANTPGQHRVIFPTRTASPLSRPAASTQSSTPQPLQYGGGANGIGVVTGSPKVYLVFWGSQWGSSSTNSDGNVQLSGDPDGLAPRLQQLMKGIGTNAELWSGVMTQYCEGVAVGATSCADVNPHVAYPTGAPYAGIWVDESGAAPAVASDDQLAHEAELAATHFGNTTAPENRNTQYFVVSPSGTNPGGFDIGTAGQFCAWHDDTLDGYSPTPAFPVAFTNMPYLTDVGPSCGANYVNGGAGGNLDGVTIVGGHEYAETLTDPDPPGGWLDASTNEDADKCGWIGLAPVTHGGAVNVAFSTGTFAMQGTWSNDSGRCENSHAVVTTVPPTPNDFTITAAHAVSVPRASSGMQVRITTSVTSGAAEAVTLSVSGQPAGVTPSFSANPIVAGSSSNLLLSVASTTTPGTYPLTVTGTSPSTHHALVVSLVVTANNFALSLSAPSITARQTTSVSTTVHVTATAGAAQSVTLSVSGLPPHATAKFATNPVATGASTSVTMTPGIGTDPGGYNFSVVGRNATPVANTVPLHLSVTSYVHTSIINGGFDTNLSSWSGLGKLGLGAPLTGAHAALLGSATVPTNGDSYIDQTFKASSTSLSFWYNVSCRDTLATGWATAMLRDISSGTSVTVLPKVCNNAHVWRKVIAAMRVGHYYMLVLVSHDNNHPGNPTSTRFDAVVAP